MRRPTCLHPYIHVHIAINESPDLDFSHKQQSRNLSALQKVAFPKALLYIFQKHLDIRVFAQDDSFGLMVMILIYFIRLLEISYILSELLKRLE